MVRIPGARLPRTGNPAADGRVERAAVALAMQVVALPVAAVAQFTRRTPLAAVPVGLSVLVGVVDTNPRLRRGVTAVLGDRNAGVVLAGLGALAQPVSVGSPDSLWTPDGTPSCWPSRSRNGPLGRRPNLAPASVVFTESTASTAFAPASRQLSNAKCRYAKCPYAKGWLSGTPLLRRRHGRPRCSGPDARRQPLLRLRRSVGSPGPSP